MTNIFPPIIDKGLFAEVQKRLAKNRILAGANSAIEPYLLTGKAFCGHCETPIVADGGTSRNGTKHYYYSCKRKKKDLCDKKRENKNDLEMRVTEFVREFLSDRKNAERVASDIVAYYERRAGDNGLRSIEVRISNAQREAESLTTAFIEAKSALLRANIERKMSELETQISDLQTQRAQLAIERGQRITKEQILDFIADLLTGDPNDKEYQRKLIANLVSAVYVYDNELVTYLTFGVEKSIERVRLDETNLILERLSSVQTQKPLVAHPGVEPGTT